MAKLTLAEIAAVNADIVTRNVSMTLRHPAG
jgi:hypothetical protein